MEHGLKEIEWRLTYYTSDVTESGKPVDILHDFYLPALNLATRYDRVAGYFRSSSLAAASQGYTAFLRHGGKMRLIVGADLQVQDVAAVLAGNQQRLADTLMEELRNPESWPDEVQSGVALLAQMVASGQLEMRVAFRKNSVTGQALSVDSTEDGYVHEKWFVMEDSQGDRLMGSGSLNESRTALTKNAENLDIHCAWEGKREKQRVDEADVRFDTLWANRNPHMLVLPLPEAVRGRLVHLKDLRNHPTEIDGTVLRVEVEPTLEEMLRFAVLRDATKMPGGKYIGMYSAPVEPWPHQEIVSRRLVESWPYSYMMCDEVGLGKTIEAALAIRSLVLSGWAKRVLIVAPASLTDQWQRELAQKALLPFYKSKPKPGGSGKIQHTRIYPEECELLDNDLYSPDLNIVSSGLVSRKERFAMLRSAQQYDIILVDEAHYARRQNPRDGSNTAPKYGQLYRALQNGLRPKAKTLWMATATPMQIDPIEVYDLFRLTNRVGPYQHDPTLSMHYFELMSKLVKNESLTRLEWAMLGQSYHQIEALDPFLWNRLNATVVTGKNRKVLENLPWKEPKKADIRYLLQPMFAASPLSRVMMRHTRQLLEKYRENGELKSNLARRHVRPICVVRFTEAEAKFYGMLEDYCTELTRQIRQHNQQSRQMMFFLLNFLQLRFASSLYAIQMTLERRLRRVEQTLLVGAAQFETQEELDAALDDLRDSTDDDYSEGDLDDITLDALLKDRSQGDLEWEKERLSIMLRQLHGISETPSKIQALLMELDHRRAPNDRIRQTVLFTRFYDTLQSIRNYLRVRDAGMRVGIYAGGRAIYYNPASGKDENVTHEEIKRLFLIGEIDLLLCTDAAVEGLNLQTADLLINFDLGWNPMKVEQRIGRIDRIGQKYSDIEVLNMCYLGSTEEIVYGRLLERLKAANLVVGTQQISMLPVEPEEFRDLQNGTLSEDELEQRSKQRLRKQRAATAAMEISADDQYEMYKRLSANAKSLSSPATIYDLWDAFISSSYLASKGATTSANHIWHLPGSEDFCETYTTISRNDASENFPFLTWGNESVDAILNAISCKIPKDGPIQRISVQHNGVERISYLVASVSGPMLIKSVSDLDGLQITQNGFLTAPDIAAAKQTLAEFLDSEQDQVLLAKKSEQENQKYASLQEALVQEVAKQILQQEEDCGNSKYSDAMRHLEETRRQIRHVSLPVDIFSNKQMQLIFPLAEQSGAVFVSAQGFLLDCAIEYSERIASTIKIKKSEITTAMVLSRLT